MMCSLTKQNKHGASRSSYFKLTISNQDLFTVVTRGRYKLVSTLVTVKIFKLSIIY